MATSFVLETFGTFFGSSGTLSSLFSLAEKAYVRLQRGWIRVESRRAACDLEVSSIVYGVFGAGRDGALMM